MAHSLSDELRQPPSPARLADMVLRHSFDDRRYRQPLDHQSYWHWHAHARTVQPRCKPSSVSCCSRHRSHVMLQPRGHGPGALGAALAAVVLAAAGQLSGGAAAAGKGGGGGKGRPGRRPLRWLRRGARIPAPRVHHVRLLYRCANVPVSFCWMQSASSQENFSRDWAHLHQHSIMLSNAGGTHLASVRHTLFGWNNETLNAWTMIIGLMITFSLWLLAR